MSTVTLNYTMNKLIEIVSKYTKIEKNEIDVYENLTETGVDSIIFTQVKDDVKQNFGLEIPFSKIYHELNTIYKIAEYIKDNFNNQPITDSGAKSKEENRIDNKKYNEFQGAMEEVAATRKNNDYNEEILEEGDLKSLLKHQLKIIKKQLDTLKGKGNRETNTCYKNRRIDKEIKNSHVKIGVTDESTGYNEDDFEDSYLKSLFTSQLKIIEMQIDIIGEKYAFVNNESCEDEVINKETKNLDKDEEIREFPLTKEQESILAQCEMSDSSLAFNEAVALKIKGKINISILEESLIKVVERHEALRTVIDKVNKKQTILCSMPAEIEVIDKKEIDTAEILSDIVSENFGFSDKLFRVKAIKESEEQWILVLVVHHIIADGWSLGVLYSEMKEFYNSRSIGKKPELKAPVQFREYIKIKNEIAGLNNLDEAKEFWNKNSSRTDNYVDVGLDFSTNNNEFSGARYEFTKDMEMLKLLRRISAKNNTSIFHTMLSLFTVFLSKITKSKNITVGVPFAGQNIINAGNLIGNCVEMIGVNLEIEEYESLNGISDKVKKYFGELEGIGYIGSENQNNSYNVVFSMNKRAFDYNLYETEIEYIPVPITESKYDLFLSILEFEDKLHIRFDYNKGVLTEATIKRWAAYFEAILKARIDENTKHIDELNVIPDEESELILDNFTTFKYEYVNRKLREDLSNYGILESQDVRVFVLDNDMQIAGIGLLGEIYIGTNEVEIYNTNKIGRVLENGELVVLGEEKKQIKIKGRNVSLFIIEEMLRNNTKILDAACEYEYESSEIKAYIVEKGKITNATEIVAELRKELPAFMIPNTYIKVFNLEERNKGQVIEYNEDLTDIEEKMLNIWTEILEIKKISVEDNFFNLGGNSLKAMKLISNIQSEFNKKVLIKDLFEQPTIRKLSKVLDSSDYCSSKNKVLKVDHIGNFEVSSVQKRMYALHKLDRESLNYNVPFVMIITGDLEKEKLVQTVNKIIKRHETLRTYFEEINGTVIQKTAKNFRIKVKYQEITNVVDDKTFIEEKMKQFIRPFDLNKLPLIRAELIKIEEEKHLLLFDFHHIVFDGASSVIFAREFASIYSGMELQELEVQYKDYAVWNNEFATSSEMKKQEDYWNGVLSDGVPVLNFHGDFKRPVNQTFKGSNIYFEINDEVSNKIDEFCKSYNVTPYMFFLAGINILLSKYSGQEDIVIGAVVEGRNNLELDNLIGMFVNTIPMRNKPISGKTFIEFLSDVRHNTLCAFENSEYQFEDMVDLIDVARDSSRNPIFDVMFVFQNNQIRELNAGDLTISGYEIKPESSRLDLSFEVRYEATNYKCNIEYNTDIFVVDTVERLKEHFKTLLENILNKANGNICDIEVLSDTERNKLIFEFNKEKVNYPKDKTIHQLFEEQVEKNPDNTAVVYGEEKLTYSELNRKANELAKVLREKGVVSNSIVGIIVERSIEMIIGIVGILKSGGAYLPIDLSYPKERIEYILDDSGIKTLILKGDMPSSINFIGDTIDLMKSAAFIENDSNLENVNTPQDIAYIIYTSGTTGKPKGAILEHKNVVRLFFNDKSLFDFNQKDIWTMFHSYCFDFSVWEMYGALLYGGKLVIVPETIARDPKEYLRMLIREKVTILNQTPSAFYNLANHEMEQSEKKLRLRYIIFGGEELKPRKLKEWKYKYPNTRLINMYGITETTVHVTYKEIKDKDIEIGISNIGKPIPTLSTYIVNSNMRLLPLGVPGELCVSGEGLARGYLNRPELTEEKFIPNPLIPGERMYRSGDLARWLPDGDLEYLGRIDHQVKIRGHRVEIGEVEATLNEYYGVKDSIVTARKGVSGDTRLVAYVIPKTDEDIVFSTQEQDKNFEQVEQWEEVFDGVYSKEADSKDEMFNIVGWDSSYTGKPIPEKEMAEWLNTTIGRILLYKPNQVLEVGCGTGMILYRVAPNCNEYCATDLSSQVINSVEKVVKKDNILRDKVSLINTRADDFSNIKGQYDFAIFNSIVQYFPSIDYLLNVLEKTIAVLQPGSTIFMGDIRNYSLLKEFHTSVTLYKSKDDMSIEDLRYHIEKNIAMDSELVIDPMFFYALKAYFPRITHVDIFYKKGSENNELTLFRYDAVLHLGTNTKCSGEISYKWEEDKLDLKRVEDILTRERPDTLSILDVPNSRMDRLSTEISVLSDETNLKIVREVIEEVDKRLLNEGIEFEDFRQMDNLEYSVEILWAGPRKDNYYNVIFIRKTPDGQLVRNVYSDFSFNIETDCQLSRYVNNPLKAKYLKNFVGDLKSYLKTRLPEYMIPANFIQLEKFPLTSNGKINKKALPESNVNQLITGKYEAPRNKTQERLAEIWRKVLGIDIIDINDNFFDLGGHSLNATVVTNEIHKEFNVEVPLKELFKNPKIKELSVYIENSTESTYETIEKCEEKEYYETSSAQKRLYTLQQFKKDSIAYNMPAIFELEGEIDKDKIETTFKKLVQRHESLRTYFETIDGQIVQKIDNECVFKMKVWQEKEKGRGIQAVAGDFIRRFELEKAPLLRLELVEVNGKSYLLIDMHHIISDGVSVDIFIKEFSMLYNGIELETLRLNYKDFAEWQNKFLKSEKLEKQKEYWINIFTDKIPILNLPYDYERSKIQDFEGDNVSFSLNEETTNRLRMLAKETESTVHMVLLSVLNILLLKYSGQDCVVVGVPVAGRPHADLQNIMGIFVNTLAIKNNPNEEKTFKKFLKEVKENSIKAYENQSYQFEALIEEINVKREQGRNPLFDVMFNMINADYSIDIDLDGLTLKPCITENKISKFDLTLTAAETNRNIEMDFEYSSRLFKRSTIERAIRDIILIIGMVLNNTDIEISKIYIRSEEEQQYIINEDEHINSIRNQDFAF